jgi:hypothetical protein
LIEMAEIDLNALTTLPNVGALLAAPSPNVGTLLAAPSPDVGALLAAPRFFCQSGATTIGRSKQRPYAVWADRRLAAPQKEKAGLAARFGVT